MMNKYRVGTSYELIDLVVCHIGKVKICAVITTIFYRDASVSHILKLYILSHPDMIFFGISTIIVAEITGPNERIRLRGKMHTIKLRPTDILLIFIRIHRIVMAGRKHKSQ